jgi:uncharacterized membrane protein YkvA (DUF1232 family)
MRALKLAAYLLGALGGVVYLLNPGAGLFEILPDTLPVIGNLDEAAAVGLVVACVRGLRALRASPGARAATEDQPETRKDESAS